MKRKKLIIKLKGGLGNQMFQYATAFSVAKYNNMDLVLDNYTGFLIDLLYHRSFSLDKFNLSTRLASPLERAPFLFEHIFGKRSKNLIKKRPWGVYFKENTQKDNYENLFKDYKNNLYLDGYWQNENYFKKNTEDILREFRLPIPNNKIFLKTAENIKKENAIAIGLRLFEEAPINFRKATPFSFYEKIADKFKDKSNNVFYLFSTKLEPIKDKLNLPGKVCYITPDNGYSGEIENLWLFSQFKNYIISSSTYYWWGVWISERNNPNIKTYADNSVFSYYIPYHWLSH